MKKKIINKIVNKIIILLILLFVVVSCTKNQEVQKNNSLPDNQQENNGLEKIKECEKDLDCPQPKCIGVRGLCDAGVCKLQGECLGQDDLKPKDKECNADLDCVKAGCSAQLCVSKEKSDIITTCEYRSEYDCLKKTICGCVRNKCEWKETGPYRDCINTKS